MNYREKIRKAIECPQFGNETYGEWGALTLEQRKYIKRLLDELDRADNYIKRLYLENEQLKEKINNIKKIIIDNSYNELYEWFNELREERVIEIVNILDIKKDIEKKRGGINEC